MISVQSWPVIHELPNKNILYICVLRTCLYKENTRAN